LSAGSPVPLRVALIGYGLAGRVFHRPLIIAAPDFVITSVVTNSAERRAAVEHEIPGARVIDMVDQLWDRARDHDVAVVATPNSLHAAVAISAVEAGLHVVVEKPFAVHADDAREVVDAAACRGRVLTVFHNRRWDGDFLTIAQIHSSGSIGRVSRFESRFERWQPAPQLAAWRQSAEVDAGGGVLYDLGSHVVDQAVQLFGRPAAVYAEMSRRRPDVVVDDDSFIALRHPDGVSSHLSMTAVAALPAARFRVLGATGAYVKDGLDVQEEQLRAGMQANDSEFGVEPLSRRGRLYSGGRESAHPTARGLWAGFYPMLADAIRNGAPPPVDPTEAVAVVEVLEAAIASARTGSVTQMPALAAE
jgi:predicted dehydrogenase